MMENNSREHSRCLIVHGQLLLKMTTSVNEITSTKSDLSATDFVVNRFLTKLFRTNKPNIENVKRCQYYFNFQ